MFFRAIVMGYSLRVLTVKAMSFSGRLWWGTTWRCWRSRTTPSFCRWRFWREFMAGTTLGGTTQFSRNSTQTSPSQRNASKSLPGNVSSFTCSLQTLNGQRFLSLKHWSGESRRRQRIPRRFQWRAPRTHATRPQAPIFFIFSCSFHRQMVVVSSPPPSSKSWILHWLLISNANSILLTK